jgi:hypothetical protein
MTETKLTDLEMEPSIAFPNGRKRDGSARGKPGRPKGKPNQAVFRSNLSARFLRDMKHDFDKHGPKVIANVREKDPTKWLQIMASLMPKQQEVKVDDVTEKPTLSTIELANQIAGLIASGTEIPGGSFGSGEPEDMGSSTGPSDGGLPH